MRPGALTQAARSAASRQGNAGARSASSRPEPTGARNADRRRAARAAAETVGDRRVTARRDRRAESLDRRKGRTLRAAPKAPPGQCDSRPAPARPVSRPEPARPGRRPPPGRPGRQARSAPAGPPTRLACSRRARPRLRLPSRSRCAARSSGARRRRGRRRCRGPRLTPGGRRTVIRRPGSRAGSPRSSYRCQTTRGSTRSFAAGRGSRCSACCWRGSSRRRSRS